MLKFRTHRAGVIDDTITDVVLIDIDNMGVRSWKNYVGSLEKAFVIFTAYRPGNAKNQIRPYQEIVDWCRERGHIVAGVVTNVAKPDLTDYMLVVQAMEYVMKYPILSEKRWGLVTRDVALQSAAMVLQYYVRRQNICTEQKYGVPLTVF